MGVSWGPCDASESLPLTVQGGEGLPPWQMLTMGLSWEQDRHRRAMNLAIEII